MAGAAVDVQQGDIARAGFEAVDHALVGRCAVGIAARGGVDDGGSGCVFCNAAGSAAAKDGGVVVHIGDRYRHRLGVDHGAIGALEREGVAGLGLKVRAGADVVQLGAVAQREVGRIGAFQGQHVLVHAGHIRVGDADVAHQYAAAHGDVFCNGVGREAEGCGRLIDIGDAQGHRLLGNLCAIGGHHGELVARLGFKVGRSEQAHGTGTAVNREQRGVIDARFQAVEHGTVGGRAIGVGARGGVHRHAGGGVLCQAGGTQAGKDRGLVVQIGDRQGYRALCHQCAVGRNHGELVTRLGFVVGRIDQADQAGDGVDAK